MKYDVILLDADGTFYDYDRAESNALKKACNSFGISYDGTILERYRLINKGIWSDFERGLVNPQDLRTERFKRLFSECKKDIDVNEFSTVYLKYLGEGDFLIDGAQEVCKYIYEKYRVVILTNGFTEVQHSRINRSPLKKYIHDIITSEETGYKKPEIGIFDYTFQKIAHSDKGRTLIVGDSLTSDIQGGVNYGIDTCWYNPRGFENTSGLTPTYEIRDLRELLDIL